MEVVVTTGARSRAKLQSNHHHQQTNIQFFTGRMPFLSPNQQCQSTEGKSYIIHYKCWKLINLKLTVRAKFTALKLQISFCQDSRQNIGERSYVYKQQCIQIPVHGCWLKTIRVTKLTSALPRSTSELNGDICKTFPLFAFNTLVEKFPLNFVMTAGLLRTWLMPYQNDKIVMICPFILSFDTVTVLDRWTESVKQYRALHVLHTDTR